MATHAAFIDDHVQIGLLNRAAFRADVSALKGCDVWITVEPQKRKRSLDQNAYLHAEPFPKLAAAWGESVSRVKLICMGEFWGYEPCKVTRQFLPVKAHTSDMTVSECSTFIDWLIPWALTEHGVAIDLPNWKTEEAA